METAWTGLNVVAWRGGLCFPVVINIAIIGGGPAGLRAAEVAAAGGASVTLFEAKPSVGRKFLVAGRGGLNLTHSEPRDRFATRYTGPELPPLAWPPLLAEFDAAALRQWAAGLGVGTFAATSGRVYPRELKAAPLLRRWVQRLRADGVKFALRHRWTGLRAGARWQLDFQSGDVVRSFEADAVILALGGGSWPTTGSDGGWVSVLEKLGVVVYTSAKVASVSSSAVHLADGRTLRHHPTLAVAMGAQTLHLEPLYSQTQRATSHASTMCKLKRAQHARGFKEKKVRALRVRTNHHRWSTCTTPTARRTRRSSRVSYTPNGGSPARNCWKQK